MDGEWDLVGERPKKRGSCDDLKKDDVFITTLRYAVAAEQSECACVFVLLRLLKIHKIDGGREERVSRTLVFA